MEKHARLHTNLAAEFSEACRMYYGFAFEDLADLVDWDEVIDTIDYGTGDFSFNGFHKIMMEHKQKGVNLQYE